MTGQEELARAATIVVAEYDREIALRLCEHFSKAGLKGFDDAIWGRAPEWLRQAVQKQ